MRNGIHIDRESGKIERQAGEQVIGQAEEGSRESPLKLTGLTLEGTNQCAEIWVIVLRKKA